MQATDEVTQQEKMERAKKMIEQVRGGAASRLDQKIDEIKNPEAAASVSGTNSSSDRDTESREEKMARAKAMIDKVRGDTNKADDPPKTSTGIGGTW